MNLKDKIKEYLTSNYTTLRWSPETNYPVLDDKEFYSGDFKELQEDIYKDVISKEKEVKLDKKDISKTIIKSVILSCSPLEEPEEITPTFKRKPWQKGMEITDKGVIMDSALNNTLLFEQHPCFKGKVFYDEIYNVEKYRYMENGVEKETILDDTGLSKLKVDVEMLLGGNRNINNIKASVLAFCMNHRRNPLVENIHNLKGKATGTKNLEEFFIKAYECDDTDYIRYVTKVLFYAWMNRMLHPGCMCDYMFVFEGAQGIGKSKLLPKMIKLLGGRGTENMKFDNDRNSLEIFSSYQLCQSEELKDMKKADLSVIKDLISRTQDTFDRKYRSTKTYDRTCILVGNVNPEDKAFLKDLADYERRFIIFPCKAEGYPNGVRASKSWWDKNFTDEYCMQVWAEAYWMVENEPNFMWLSLPVEVSNELKEIQKGYKAIMMDDVFLDKLKDTLDLPFHVDTFTTYDDFVAAVDNAKTALRSPKNVKQLSSIPKNIWRRYVKDVLKEDRSLGYFDKAMEVIGWEYNHTTRYEGGKRVNIFEYRRIKEEGGQVELEL